MEGNNDALAQLAHAYGTAGRRADAVRTIRRMHEKRSHDFVGAGYFAVAYAGLALPDSVFHYLDLALEDHSETALFAATDPVYATLRGDPRMASFIRRAGLAP
jgi:hypothetical protein